MDAPEVAVAEFAARISEWALFYLAVHLSWPLVPSLLSCAGGSMRA